MTIPTLAEYIAKHCGESRGEGFDAFEASTAKFLAMPEPQDPAQRAVVRWLRLFSIAIVEGLRSEEMRGEGLEASLVLLPTTLGLLVHQLVASNVYSDAPFDDLARILSKDFRDGARQSARAIHDAEKRRATT